MADFAAKTHCGSRLCCTAGGGGQGAALEWDLVGIFFVNGRGWSSGCRVQQETMTQFIMACAGADGTPSSSLGWSDADA